MKKSNHKTQSEKQPLKVYRSPVLKEYGTIVLNTAGSTGTKGDAGVAKRT